MSILRDFEKRLEGAVEGFFARAFRSGLQPVELAKAIQRYETNYQQVGTDSRVMVPNVFRFTLSPGDLERFSGFTRTLQRELADVARRTADDKGWHTHGPIRIEFERSEKIRVGTFQLRGKTEAPGAAAAAAAPPLSPKPRQPAPQQPAPQQPAPLQPQPATAAPPPAPAAPQAATRPPQPTAPLAPQSSAGADSTGRVLRIIEGNEAGKVMPLPAEAVIGRHPECEITVTGASVSRRHAKVQLEGDRWTVTDLGSTNGVRLNGDTIQAGELRPGDTLDVGGVIFSFMVTGSSSSGA